MGGDGREKAAGKEAQEAVKCRTRKKDGRTDDGCLCVRPRPSVRPFGLRGKSRLVAIRKEEVRGRKVTGLWPTRESVRPFKSGKTDKNE